MTSSLVLSTVGELIPATATAPGLDLLLDYDLGDPQSVTTTVEALLLDGERVTRTRSGNRTFELPLLVRGSSRSDLTARVDALLDTATQDGATLTWTPDGGLPIVWDCFPAQPTVHWDVRIEEKAWVQQVDLTIPALPFGRSPDAESPTLVEGDATTFTQRWTLTGLLGSAPAPVGVVLPFTMPTDGWVLHRPPRDAAQDAPIAADLTDGAVTLADAELLHGTYTIAVGVGTYGEVGEDRIATVTVSQAGTDATQELSVAYVSALNLRHLIVGNVTLPLVDRPEGASIDLDVTVDDSGGSTFHTLLLLDTRGQTVQGFAQSDGGTTECAWIDAPDVGAVVGPLWSGPTTTRADAYAVSESRISGGPLTLDTHDEDGVILAYGNGLPDEPTLGYYPRWLAERVE